METAYSCGQSSQAMDETLSWPNKSATPSNFSVFKKSTGPVEASHLSPYLTVKFRVSFYA